MDNIKIWKGVVIIGAIIIVILGVALSTMEPKESQPMQDMVEKMDETKNMTAETMDKNVMDDKMMDQTDEKMMDKKMEDEVVPEIKTETIPATESTMTKPKVGSYLTYNAEAVAKSEAENIVLFFHATWCPSCSTLNADITNNASNIPAGTEIYKVDYDTYTELKKKYGVTYQHTLVLIKADGTLIKKWSGGASLSQLVTNL